VARPDKHRLLLWPISPIGEVTSRFLTRSMWSTIGQAFLRGAVGERSHRIGPFRPNGLGESQFILGKRWSTHWFCNKLLPSGDCRALAFSSCRRKCTAFVLPSRLFLRFLPFERISYALIFAALVFSSICGRIDSIAEVAGFSGDVRVPYLRSPKLIIDGRSVQPA